MDASRSNVAEREGRLGDILAMLIEAAERGEPLDRGDWLARHLPFAAELNEYFDCEERLRSVAAPLRAAVGMDTPRPTATLANGGHTTARAGSMVGDYEILEEIGRGGMGVVYRARQARANRVVALKMLRADSICEGESVRRFRNEAEIVARLDHPNIVPLYEVGGHAGAVYFSMKLIEGGSLAERLPAFADDPRSTAAVVAAVARAVHHAHQRGVLHRDLKPSNILLDGEGRPYVTDFGLARRVEGDSSLTQSGAVVGTPSFMAPEQAAGHRAAVTTATDVYGLGAVLYTLLAGRPPFQADSVLEILAQIQQRDAEPPSRYGGDVDRDLETVCLKCLHKEPQHRYASAEALAADLERWLKGEPIEARPMPSLARVGRWCRRNPVVAGSVATTALLLVLTLVGLAVGVWLLWRERAATQAALVKADAKNRWARRAVNEMYAEVADEWLGDQPHRTEVQRRFLRQALAFYEELAEEKSLDPQEQLETAIAYRRMAAILHELEPHNTKGQELAKRAAAILQTLVEQFPAVAEYHCELCQVKQELGKRLLTCDSFSEAEVHLREANELSESLVKESPHNPVFLKTRSFCLHTLGELFRRTHRLVEAEKALREAVAIQRRLAAESRSEPGDQLSLCDLYRDWVLLLLDTGHFSEAEKVSREALPIFQQAARQHPRLGDQLGACYNGLGTSLLEQGRFQDAAEVIGLALTTRERHHASFPDRLSVRYGLAMTYSNYGRVLTRLAKHREAEAAYRQAIRLQQRIVNDDPTQASRSQELILLHSNLAWLHAIGPAEVRDAPKALGAIRKALEEEPTNPTYSTALGVIYYRLGEWDRALNTLYANADWAQDPTRQVPKWRSSAANLRLISEHNTRTAAVLHGFFLAMSYHRRGESRRARDCYRQAEKRAREQDLGASCWVEEVKACQAEAAALLGVKDGRPRNSGSRIKHADSRRR